MSRTMTVRQLPGNGTLRNTLRFIAPMDPNPIGSNREPFRSVPLKGLPENRRSCARARRALVHAREPGLPSPQNARESARLSEHRPPAWRAAVASGAT